MELEPKNFKKFLPLPLTLITTVDTENVPNAAPYACVMPILRPLDLIAVASGLPRDTLRNIRSTGEFVVNVMGRPTFRRAIKCAKHFPPEVDELKEMGLDTLPSKKVAPPRVKDAIGWIEAKLEEEHPGERHALIIARAVLTEVNDEYLTDGELTELPVVVLAPSFRALGETVALRDEFAEEIGPIRF